MKAEGLSIYDLLVDKKRWKDHRQTDLCGMGVQKIHPNNISSTFWEVVLVLLVLSGKEK